jgi:hypothetical protein
MRVSSIGSFRDMSRGNIDSGTHFRNAHRGWLGAPVPPARACDARSDLNRSCGVMFLCYRGHVVPSTLAFRNLQRRADRLSRLIVATNVSQREIDIERLYLRTEAARLFSDKLAVYDMIYESRFRRLCQQFRRVTPRADDR